MCLVNSLASWLILNSIGRDARSIGCLGFNHVFISLAYNNSVNKSTGHSPFEIVTGLKSRQNVDVAPLPIESRINQEAEKFSRHIHNLHEEIQKRIEISNQQYTSKVDLHKRNVEFQEGDQVMIKLRLEHFPKGEYQKLHYRKVRPYKVLKQLGCNVELLVLPMELSIIPIFNVEDLSPYYRAHEEIEEELSTPRLLEVLKTNEDIKDVLDEQTILTRKGSYKKFLVKWKRKLISKGTWIIAFNFQQSNPKLYKTYQAFHLTEMSSSK